MTTYQFFQWENGSRVIKRSDNVWIPIAPDNTDYQNFKKEVLAGAELQDADGNVMTQAEADAFIATLP
jgi:hypothetical protein